MQTRSRWWPLWLGRVRPEQASSVRKLLIELPLSQLHVDSAVSDFLDRFEALLPMARLDLMLAEEGAQTAHCGVLKRCPAVAGCPLLDHPATDSAHACAPCRRRGVHRLLCATAAAADVPSGWLLLDTPRAADGSWRQLFNEVAQGLSVTLRVRGYSREQQRKQATSQHAALARELHDSVAQQLGYLSFQARVLHAQINMPEQAGAVLQELRSGLSQLQRQVRELITSARLTMDGRSLRQALADSVAEFSRRCIIVFELDNRLADNTLSAETELQVLQIIREALANAVRHSHARHVRIELRQSQGGEVSVLVEDDGIGLSPASGEENHFGLAIIRERAASIGARLSIDANRPHGVCVHLALVGHPDVPEGSFDAEHHLIADR